MACSTNSISRLPKDNREIRVTITDSEGDSIPGISSDTTNIIFQAKDSTGVVVLDLQMVPPSGPSKISLINSVDDTGTPKNVALIEPTTADMDISPGNYDVFLQFTLQSPVRIIYVSMFKSNNPITNLIILEGGVTP